MREDRRLKKFLKGELAQLARALRWQRRGHRFESGILHQSGGNDFKVVSPAFLFLIKFLPTSNKVAE